MAADISEFTYLSRFPPSPSGVAAYAAAFHGVLDLIAPTRALRVPSDPRQSQRLVTLLTTVRRASAIPASGSHVFVVELAGRGLAEFWTIFLLTRRPWNRRIWVTVHDPPALSGGAFFFAGLDRRGGRRFAKFLSDRLGRRAERAALDAAERVFCLSDLGAGVLADRLELTRRVERLPHVARVTQTPLAGRASVFLPGYLDGVENVAPIVTLLPSLPAGWVVEVGACSVETRVAVDQLAKRLKVDDRVRNLGFLPEDELSAVYDRSAIVVRWRAGGWSRSGAVSGPLIRAMSSGCAIVTNDARGIRECLSPERAIEVATAADGAEDLSRALLELSHDEGRRVAMGEAGRRHIAIEHEAASVASVLERS